jgi:N-acyl-D-aspartate/D-glutamate deacylase
MGVDVYDLVIRGGHIVDGTGQPAFVGDVAVKGGKIAAIGTFEGEGAEEIDATGLLVTPGWVDMHTHYDGQVTWDPYLTPSGWHGVTTVVMGNCGVGFAPVRPKDREWLIETMEGVEDIPGTALTEGIKWEWETFPEYLDALEGMPHAIDLGTQVAHSALRGYVMGHRGAENDDASPEEIVEMKKIVVEALEAGALGFSTSRTSLHKTSAGNLMAGTYASREELFGIGEAIRDVGHGVFELADEHQNVPEDTTWLTDLAELTGQPVVFNLSQIDQAPQVWKRGLEAVEKAQAKGVPLYCQVAGRAIGVMQCWQGTVNPFLLTNAHAEISHLPWEERLEALRDPERKARLLAEEPFFVGEFEAFVTRSFDKMFLFGEHNDYEPSPDNSIAAIAERRGVTPMEVAYETLMANDGTGMIYFPLFNYAEGSLEPLRQLHTHPGTRMGLSDGGAHCGAVCDSGMPTFMVTHWTRDRSRGERIPLEHIVKRQTSQTAEFYGLHDRGVLAPGYLADVNIIDYDALRLEAPKMVFDLPAQGRRLVQRARGYRWTIKSGEIIMRDDAPTGAMPGKLVRGPQPAP